MLLHHANSSIYLSDAISPVRCQHSQGQILLQSNNALTSDDNYKTSPQLLRARFVARVLALRLKEEGHARKLEQHDKPDYDYHERMIQIFESVEHILLDHPSPVAAKHPVAHQHATEECNKILRDKTGRFCILHHMR